MTTENHFNLIDEPWIPVVDVGLASLRDIFSHSGYRALGGNPVQKIALTKLLLAIAQAAATPADDEAWAELGAAGLSAKCLDYLERWRDRFWLYGERPFLQMPAIRAANAQSFGAVLAEVATGNTTVLTQTQIEKSLSDADKALLIVVLMGFGLGGKKTDNSATLSRGYVGKTNDRSECRAVESETCSYRFQLPPRHNHCPAGGPRRPASAKGRYFATLASPHGYHNDSTPFVAPCRFPAETRPVPRLRGGTGNIPPTPSARLCFPAR